MALTNQKHFTNKPLPFHRQIKKITDKPKKQIAKNQKNQKNHQEIKQKKGQER